VGLRGGIRRLPTPQIPMKKKLSASTLRFLTFEGITIQLLQQGATTAKHHVISRLDFFPKTGSKKKHEKHSQKTLVQLAFEKIMHCPFWKCLFYVDIYIFIYDQYPQ